MSSVVDEQLPEEIGPRGRFVVLNPIILRLPCRCERKFEDAEFVLEQTKFGSYEHDSPSCRGGSLESILKSRVSRKKHRQHRFSSPVRCRLVRVLKQR